MELDGKHLVITGPTAGIGRAAALALAQQGALLTLLCRDLEKGDALVRDIAAAGGQRASVVQLDMANLDSVRRAAGLVLDQQGGVDILLNNAGVINTSRRLSANGFEEMLAVNHLAPFLLTGLLLPSMLNRPGARIVNVASAAYTFVRGMGFEDLQALESYRTFHEYGRSKLANILFTRELARRLQGRELTVNCLHPGAVSTALGSQNKGVAASLLPLLLKPFFKSPEQGARTSIYLCASSEVASVSGEYFVNCRPAKLKPWAKDQAAAEQLWRYSENAVDYVYPL